MPADLRVEHALNMHVMATDTLCVSGVAHNATPNRGLHISPTAVFLRGTIHLVCWMLANPKVGPDTADWAVARASLDISSPSAAAPLHLARKACREVSLVISADLCQLP